MSGRYIYPFTAIVGQERMRLALLLHAVNPRLGGVLVRGEKGTAKSTAVRALAAILPANPAIEGCPYGCDPSRTSELCESCAVLLAEKERPGVVQRPVSVVELPIGATEDRVLGSLDLEHAIQTGTRKFEPGLLARANHGILYVDEVNLLGDHLVDVILDAAALGWNYVEREGVSFAHPASFMLIGTMNPEEGDLRPQLLDRFALTVEVTGLGDPEERAEVVRRRMAFERDPAAFIAGQAAAEQEERERLARAREILPSVVVPESALQLIVRICVAFAVDGLRCDLAIYRTATALAAYAGRAIVKPEDIRLAAELALPHRQRRQPFDETGLDENKLDEVMNGDCQPDLGQKSQTSSHSQSASAKHDAVTGNGGANESRSSGRERDSSEAQVTQPGPVPPLTLSPSPVRRGAGPEGRRSGKGPGPRGAAIGAGSVTSEPFELAPVATLRAAAPHQHSRSGLMQPAIQVLPDDLRQRIRQARAAELVVFVVDASGSMGAGQRMRYAKAAGLGLLHDAYRKRDRVAIIAFRGDRAEVLVPPTNSVDLAERRLRFLPTGGRTPLARGLQLARETIERAIEGNDRLAPLVVVVSDSRANVGLGNLSPWPAAMHEAQIIRRQSWPSLLVDAGGVRAGAGLGRALAAALGARVIPARFDGANLREPS